MTRPYRGVALVDRVAERRAALVDDRPGLPACRRAVQRERALDLHAARLTPRYFYESFADLDELLARGRRLGRGRGRAGRARRRSRRPRRPRRRRCAPRSTPGTASWQPIGARPRRCSSPRPATAGWPSDARRSSSSTPSWPWPTFRSWGAARSARGDRHRAVPDGRRGEVISAVLSGPAAVVPGPGGRPAHRALGGGAVADWRQPDPGVAQELNRWFSSWCGVSAHGRRAGAPRRATRPHRGRGHAPVRRTRLRRLLGRGGRRDGPASRPERCTTTCQARTSWWWRCSGAWSAARSTRCARPSRPHPALRRRFGPSWRRAASSLRDCRSRRFRLMLMASTSVTGCNMPLTRRWLS